MSAEQEKLELKKGDKVVVNVPYSKRETDRTAIVTSLKTTTPDCIRVLYDGLKKPQTVHKTFCKLVTGEKTPGEE